MSDNNVSRREFVKISSTFLASSAIISSELSFPSFALGEDSDKNEEKVVHTICELCFWRCGVDAHVKNGRVYKITGQKDHPLSNGKLCPRGTGGHGLLYDPDRIKHPLIRETVNGKQQFRKASWDEALGLIADKLKIITERYGTESTVFLSHGFGASFFKTLLKAYGIGTFTAPSYGQCRGARQEAFKLTYGHGVGSPEGLDIANSTYLVLIGSHLGENMHNTAVQDFSQAVKRGAKIVVVDPRYSTAAGKAEKWLPIKAGTDLALLRSWIHVIVKNKLYDIDFVEKNTVGLKELWAGVKDATPEATYALTGISADDIEGVARDLARHGSSALVHPGRHVAWYGDDTQRERAIAILNALLGNYRMPGGFITQPGFKVPKVKFPVAHKSTTNTKSKYPLARKPPANEIVERTLTGKPYDIKAWFVYGTNLIHSLGDQKSTIEAIQKLDFMVAVDVLPVEITSYADVILPESTYLERYDDLDTRTYKTPYVALRQPAVKPMFDTKPGHEIAAMLAAKLGMPNLFPKNIESYLDNRLKKIDSSLAELKKKGVLTKPTNMQYRQPGEILSLNTPSGKIELASSSLRHAGLDPIPKYTSHPENPPGYFRMLFGRAPMHTFGRTANNRFLGEIMPENELWVNRIAGTDMGLVHGEYIYLVNQDNVKSRTKIKVKLTERIRADVVYMVHGFGHTAKGLTFARNRGASDADMITRLDIDPVMGGTGMQNNFVTFTREA